MVLLLCCVLNLYCKVSHLLKDSEESAKICKLLYFLAKGNRKVKGMKERGGIVPHSVSLKDSRTIKIDAHFLSHEN